MLFVNSVNYLSLPYRYDSNTSEGARIVECTANVLFDNSKITVPDPWCNRDFVQNFFEALGG